MRKVSSLALLAAAFIGVAASAEAATLPVSDTYSHATNWTHTLSVSQFNTSLGELTNVKVELSRSLDTNITVEALNGGASGQAYTSYQFTEAPAIPAADGDTNPSLQSAKVSYSLATTGDGVILHPAVTTSKVTFSYLGDTITDLSPYQGLGTISIPLTTDVLAWTTAGGGNVDVSQVTTAGATLTVTYTYTPIPEPMAFGLMGLSAAGLMIRRRQA